MDRLRAGRMPGQPWFAYVNLGITHESGMWPDKENPPARTHDPSKAPVPSYLPDDRDVRGDIARHYDNMTTMDAQAGEILDALQASGEAERGGYEGPPEPTWASANQRRSSTRWRRIRSA